MLKQWSAAFVASQMMMMNRVRLDNVVGPQSQSGAEAMREALQSILLRTECGSMSKQFVECLLMEPRDVDIGHDDHIQPICNPGDGRPLYEQMRGVPRRPYYAELSQRLSAIKSYRSKSSAENSVESLPFLKAAHFGVVELQCLNALIPEPPMQLASWQECSKWINKAGESGILATLGMRRTVGTVSKCFDATAQHGPHCYLLPPSRSQLLASSRELHRPNSKSCLTVGARALAKHAHRGCERFFGMCQGSESEKNEQAEVVVKRLIDEAAWINIHAFGGVDESQPVMEVRTAEGYGARWSAVWRDTAFNAEDVQFRGFLEPQMEGGHENRWRH